MTQPQDKIGSALDYTKLYQNTFPVLDEHGFIRVVDIMGDESSIVQAARVSYGDGTRTLREDAKLIEYLAKNGHTTPFEMCEIKFHVKLPLFVARQWIRHRTGSFNEYSARYSEVREAFYFPSIDNMRQQSPRNKQEGDKPLVQHAAIPLLAEMKAHCKQAYELYRYLLDSGVSREQARMVLPTNVYTEWYWKTDLHNLYHFLALRCDSHAQWEIRQYANVIAYIVLHWVPISFSVYSVPFGNWAEELSEWRTQVGDKWPII